MKALIGGMLAAGYLVVALFFLRFWRDTRDRLFATFAAAFAILAVQRVLLGSTPASEAYTGLYVLRLLAFLLILYGIVEKNLAAARREW
jgi:hypothetical protein